MRILQGLLRSQAPWPFAILIPLNYYSNLWKPSDEEAAYQEEIVSP